MIKLENETLEKLIYEKIPNIRSGGGLYKLISILIDSLEPVNHVKLARKLREIQNAEEKY